jgi:hypothetical protein
MLVLAQALGVGPMTIDDVDLVAADPPRHGRIARGQH